MKCPHCGGELPTKKLGTYTDQFLEFWKAYDAGTLCPGASKKDAFKAWQQVEDERPEQYLLIRCLDAYKANLKSRRGDPIPAAHPSTWLRQARWDGFLDKVSPVTDAGQTPEIITHPSWNGSGEKLIAEIGVPVFKAWFGACEFDAGPPATITTSKPFVRNWIVNHFHRPLYSAFGAYEIRVR